MTSGSERGRGVGGSVPAEAPAPAAGIDTTGLRGLGAGAPPPDADVPDAELAAAAERAVEWDLWVPQERVRVAVRDGWVTLEGEVDSTYQRDAAARDVERIPGVRGVTNRLSLRPTPCPEAIRERIARALRRCADEDTAAIRVETFPGTVVLRGTVRSWAELEGAERAAWSAPGVAEVRSRLEVVAPAPAARPGAPRPGSG